MMQVLIALAWGVGTFAIIVGVMSIIVQSFITATGCPGNGASPDYTYYNATNGVCQNSSTTATISSIATNKAGTSMYYLQGQLGSTGGGLSTYAPIIIVVGIAMVIFAAFGGQGKKY